MQDGAILLWVVLRLLPLPTTTAAAAAASSPRLPAIRFLSTVNCWRAPAPAAAHGDPNRGLLLCQCIGTAGSLLGPSAASLDDCGLPDTGLQADLDLPEPGLAYRGSTKQTWAAHLDHPNSKTTRSLESAVEQHSTSLLFSVSWLSVLLSRSLLCSLSPSHPPSLSFFLSHSLLTDAAMTVCFYSQAVQRLRQRSVQFRVNAPSSMHTRCFNTCSQTVVTVPDVKCVTATVVVSFANNTFYISNIIV